eukprot:34668_1
MLSQSQTNLEVCFVNEEFQNNTEVEQNSLIADDGIYRIIKLSKIKYPELISQPRNKQIKFIEIYFKNCLVNHSIIPKDIVMLVYHYVPLTAIIGCYIFSGEEEGKRLYAEDIEYLCSFEIKSDLTFTINSICCCTQDIWEGKHYLQVGIPKVRDIFIHVNGFVQIKEQNKYQLLFNSKSGNKFVNPGNNPLLYRHALAKSKNDREKVYEQRILQLYKTEQKLNVKQIKKLHKPYFEKSDLLSLKTVNKQKKQRKKNKKQDIPLILHVLKRKIIDDVKNNKLNIRICKNKKKKKYNNKDIHVLYTYLCQHFKIKPLPMSLGDFYAKFSKNGKLVVIESDGENIFNKWKKMRKVTRNQLLTEWSEWAQNSSFSTKIAKWYPCIRKQK